MGDDYDRDEDLHAGRLVRESRTKWVAIFSQLNNRQELSNKIRITDVNMQDQRFMHLDEFTETALRVFTTE